MSVLDTFFSAAVPFVVVSLVVAQVAQRYASTRGVYEGTDGAARRDAINKRYRTNAGAVVIAAVFLALWGVTVAALVEQWGAIFFTFVISGLLLLPFATVGACAIMLYMFAVHGVAAMKDR